MVGSIVLSVVTVFAILFVDGRWVSFINRNLKEV